MFAKSWRVTTLMICAISAGGPRSACAAIAPPAEIARSLNSYVANAPGVVVIAGVVDHGTVRIYVAGKSATGAPPLDASTEFQIGSITKTFTAALLSDMVLRGEVKLDDPIGRYLPQSVKTPLYQGQPITLADLAEQNSGLPRLPGNLDAGSDDPYAKYGVTQLYDFLNAYTLSRAPGAQYEYSNVGAGLLGVLLGNAASSTYSTLLQTRVLDPLGMTNTSVDLTPAVRSRLMPGYTGGLTPSAAWSFASLGAAGAINSTMHDMLLYLRANMSPTSTPLEEAMAMAQTPRADAGNALSKIGLFWMTNPASGLTWHNGETGGYHSFIGFHRRDNNGLVLLTNVADQGADLLAVHLLEPSLVPNSPQLEPPPKPHGRSPYIGIYRLAPAFDITIFEENGTLYAQATGQSKIALTSQAGMTYRLSGVDGTITFVLDGRGRVASLVLHQNGHDMPAPLIQHQ